MSIALSVNVNKIALIRNSRKGNNPDLLRHAERCLAAGADGITVHPRPDQRHIRPEDCIQLRALPTELNIEGNPFEGPASPNRSDFSDYPGFMQLITEVKPDQATLVPDQSQQLTSDHGFDLVAQGKALAPIIDEIKQQGIRVSLFMDPVIEQIDLAKAIGADRIELYTGPYAEAVDTKNNTSRIEELLSTYFAAAAHAQTIGLGVNAGHDLNLRNLSSFAKAPGLMEVSIGHALSVDTIEMGLDKAIKAYYQQLEY
ncbi:pyridoxine 5'-phosphate synthase [bacterium]|nr:pyridoxine 5'-phosphate synthase [bacterium]